MVRALKEGENVPCPAEDLSADDDLLSWILVDQLGCLPGKGLGVHPQQVKFVGTPFKTSEVLKIVSETVVNTNRDEAKRRLLDFHLIKAHLETKVTDKQRVRFINHLVRYTLPYRPDSRIEIFTTDRYKAVTGHGELAVYATRPLPVGTLVQELQGSIVPLPDQWRDEMDIGEDFAMEAAGEEASDGESEEDEEEMLEDDNTAPGASDGRPTKRGKQKKEPKGARRSDRTKRRDFSIMWSEKDKRYQLFLGPARFLNHDCEPNVKLSRQGQYVTFRVDRPVKIGDEITTDYGPNYFGKDNIECLCLTCEKRGKGGFTKKSDEAEAATGTRSPSMPTASKPVSSAGSRKPIKPSELRNALGNLSVESHEDDSEPIAGPSGTSHEDSTPVTPRKPKPRPSLLSISRVDSPATEATGSDPDSPSEGGLPQRKRYQRKAAKNAQHFNFLKRPRKGMETGEPELLMDEKDVDCERCATCATAIQNREWDKLNNRYWEFCLRCIRHALIFDLPWPAHHSSQVLDYPPSHLIPRGYIPPRVSTIPLPSLEKNRKKHAEPAPVAPQAVSAAEKAAMKFRRYLAFKDLQDGQLHEEAWTTQETIQNQIQAAEQAKIEAREKRLEAKRLLEENKFKGSGIWNRWQYIDDAEHERREAAKNAITTGTRRGKRFKANEDEEEEKRLAEKIAAERRAAALAEQTDSDADDEADEDMEVEEEDEEEGADHHNDLEEEMEDVKPIISPKATISPRKTPYNANRIINHVRDVIDVTWISDSDNGEFEDESNSDDSIATKTRRLQRKSKKRNAKAKVSDQPEGYDSDLEELGAQQQYTPKSQRITGGVLMSSAPKLPLSPVRRTAKTKPSAKAKPRRKDVTGVENVDEPGVQRDTDHRGRGRPAGTGKKQKAAAARRTSLALAGPSNVSKHKSSPQKNGEREEHIQTRVEKQLANMDDQFFEIAIEGLDRDGKPIWKSTNDLRSNPFDFEQAVTEIIVKERLEDRASSYGNRDEINGTAPTLQSSGRSLPGQICLLSSADVKGWGPSPSEELEETAQVSITAFSTSLLPQDAPPRELVGLVRETSRLGYGRPSMADGLWSDGGFRKIVAIQRKPSGGGDALSAVINEKVGWNEDSGMVSEVVTPIIKYIKSPTTGPRQPVLTAGDSIMRLPGSTSWSSPGVPRIPGHPVDFPSRNGSSGLVKHSAESSTNGIIPRHSATPSTSTPRPHDFTPRKAVHIAPKQTASPATNVPSITPIINGSASRASATPITSSARPGGATPSKASTSTPRPNDTIGVNGSLSRHPASPSTQRPNTATPSKAASGSLDQAANGIANESTQRSSMTPPKIAIRPAFSASTVILTPSKQTPNGSATHTLATPSKGLSRPLAHTISTPLRQEAHGSTSHSGVTPSHNVSRPNGSTPVNTAPTPVKRTADELNAMPSNNGPKRSPLHRDSEVNGSASEENGFSTGTSLAEDEVEDVLDGARKRKLSVTDSPRRIKLTI